MFSSNVDAVQKKDGIDVIPKFAFHAEVDEAMSTPRAVSTLSQVGVVSSSASSSHVPPSATHLSVQDTSEAAMT